MNSYLCVCILIGYGDAFLSHYIGRNSSSNRRKAEFCFINKFYIGSFGKFMIITSNCSAIIITNYLTML